RVDERRVLSGIIFVNRNGMRWRDAPREYGPHKTRWDAIEIFARMMDGPAAGKAEPQTIIIDATYLKAYRTASILRLKMGSALPDRSYPGRYEYQDLCLTDQNGRPLGLFMTAGQTSDDTGAAALLDNLPIEQ
ncbi:transposase, partial [Gluconobacter sphaericus]|nr:transposase [Gluconobacter sphaericus]